MEILWSVKKPIASGTGGTGVGGEDGKKRCSVMFPPQGGCRGPADPARTPQWQSGMKGRRRLQPLAWSVIWKKNSDGMKRARETPGWGRVTISASLLGNSLLGQLMTRSSPCPGGAERRVGDGWWCGMLVGRAWCVANEADKWGEPK